MKKFPFTSEGAAELVATLYALPDASLAIEAQSAAEDFVAWLLSKFDFEPSQVAYLTGMSTNFLNFTGAQVCYAMLHRLTLVLLKPLQRSTRDTKLIETKSNIDASANGSGNDDASGSVVIEISY